MLAQTGASPLGWLWLEHYVLVCYRMDSRFWGRGLFLSSHLLCVPEIFLLDVLLAAVIASFFFCVYRLAGLAYQLWISESFVVLLSSPACEPCLLEAEICSIAQESLVRF